ncbi:hypothetical protein MMC10_009043 [Thelotrema lepadinum]|nr:hypothetical protein [Thelotrema lepadinum]
MEDLMSRCQVPRQGELGPQNFFPAPSLASYFRADSLHGVMRCQLLACTRSAASQRHTAAPWTCTAAICETGATDIRYSLSTISIPYSSTSNLSRSPNLRHAPEATISAALSSIFHSSWANGTRYQADFYPKPLSRASPRARLRPPYIRLHHRSFTTSPPSYKKEKGGSKRDSKQHKLEAAEQLSDAADNDPYDFSTLTTRLQTVREKLEHDLSKLRPGGRFNPETIENLRVPLGKIQAADNHDHGGGGKPTHNSNGTPHPRNNSDKKPTKEQSLRLSDFASLIPRGSRSVSLLLSSESHLKPILSTILSSNLNLNPQPSPTNPLELTIPLPPPTTETRQRTLDEASRAGEKANGAVREARGTQQKVFRAMELAGRVRSDDRFRAQKEMETLVEEAYKGVREMVEGRRRVLGGGE